MSYNNTIPSQFYPQQNYITNNNTDISKPLTINDITQAIQSAVQPINSKLNNIENTLNQRLSITENRVTLLEKESQQKQEKIDTLTKIVVNLTSVINKQDSEKRETNIIINALPESELTISTNGNKQVLNNDNEKCNFLFKTLDVPVQYISHERIGKVIPNRSRVLKIKLHSKKDRDSILEKAKLLKNMQDPINKVYIKKDVHFVYRNENKRIQDLKRPLTHY